MSKSNDCLVVYESDDEVIVCQKSKEARMIAEFFTNGNRDPDDYERSEGQEAICIWNQLLVR
jgi:hypothetical protein